MHTITLKKEFLIPVAKEMFWIAWNNSSVFGAGIYQDNPLATKEDVWNNILNSGDYPGKLNSNQSDKMDLYADYVFGRMMKMRILIDNKKKSLSYPDPEDLSPSYQSWSQKYSYFELLNEAMKKI